VSGERPVTRRHLDAVMDAPAREYYRRLAAGELATTACEGCGHAAFPPGERCPRCGGDTEWAPLPLEGRLHAFTTQETAVRFAAPTVLALAELGGAVVPGVVDAPYEELRIGQPVRAEPFPEPDTGLTLLRFVPT
jgi:uncharacterized OB-fold protein